MKHNTINAFLNVKVEHPNYIVLLKNTQCKHRDQPNNNIVNQIVWYFNIKEMKNLVDQYMESGNLVSHKVRNFRPSNSYLGVFKTTSCNNIYQK